MVTELGGAGVGDPPGEARGPKLELLSPLRRPTITQLMRTIALLTLPFLLACTDADAQKKGAKPKLDAGVQAAPAEPPKAPQMEVRWSLMNKDLSGTIENGFAQTCAASGVKSLSITAISERSGQRRTTSFPCPGTANSGNAVIQLPDTQGPFQFNGRADGKSRSASTQVCHVPHGEYASVWIFVDGCDNPKCTDACSVR